MIVLYLRADGRFLQSVRGFPLCREVENRLLLQGSDGLWYVAANDLKRVGYVYCQEQRIEPLYDDEHELPQYMSDLGLHEITAETVQQKQRDALAEIDALEPRVAVLENQLDTVAAP